MTCDSIIVMEDGEIENMDTHENLLRESKVYKEIYDSLNGGAENE